MPALSHVQIDLIEPESLSARIARVFGEPTDPIAAVERRARREWVGRQLIVWEGDPQTFQFSYVSATAEALLGHAVTRWTEERDFWVNQVVHPEDARDAVAFCALATANGRDHDFRYRAQAADGSVVELHDIVHVIKGVLGVPTRLRGVMIDVTGGPSVA
jgi:PAS domain-containing protein